MFFKISEKRKLLGQINPAWETFEMRKDYVDILLRLFLCKNYNSENSSLCICHLTAKVEMMKTIKYLKSVYNH